MLCAIQIKRKIQKDVPKKSSISLIGSKVMGNGDLRSKTEKIEIYQGEMIYNREKLHRSIIFFSNLLIVLI